MDFGLAGADWVEALHVCIVRREGKIICKESKLADQAKDEGLLSRPFRTKRGKDGALGIGEEFGGSVSGAPAGSGATCLAGG